MILRREQGEGQRPHKSETPRHQDNEQNIEPRHFAKSSISISIGLTSPSLGSMPLVRRAVGYVGTAIAQFDLAGISEAQIETGRRRNGAFRARRRIFSGVGASRSPSDP